MLFHIAESERLPILRAMSAVATGNGRHALSPADVVAIRSAQRILFAADDDVDPSALTPIAPAELAAALERDESAAAAGRILAITALIDGEIDAERLAAALAFGAALGLHEQYLIDLGEAARGHLSWLVADLARQNVVSITRGRSTKSSDLPLWPYRHAGDAPLARRYRALAGLPRGTLGREFLEWYVAHSYPIPGEPESLNELFVRSHDSTHLLSGYSTSAEGEILVSTFTSGMMGADEPLGAHVLPTMLSFHVGVRLNDLAGAWRCDLDPASLWHAWERGAACEVDVFEADWDFWGLTDVPIADLQRRYRVPPL